MQRLFAVPIALVAGGGLALYLIGLVLVRGPDAMLEEALYVSLGVPCVACLVGYLNPDLRVISTHALLLPMAVPIVFLILRSFDLYQGAAAAAGHAALWAGIFALTMLTAHAAAFAGARLYKRLSGLPRRFGFGRRRSAMFAHISRGF